MNVSSPEAMDDRNFFVPKCSDYYEKMKDDIYKLKIINELVLHQGTKSVMNQTKIPVHPVMLDVLTDQDYGGDAGEPMPILIHVGKSRDVTIVVQFFWTGFLNEEYEDEYVFAIGIVGDLFDREEAKVKLMEIMNEMEEKFPHKTVAASRFLTKNYNCHYFEKKIRHLLK